MATYNEEYDCCRQQVDDKIWGLLCNESGPDGTGGGIFEDFKNKLFGCFGQYPGSAIRNVNFFYGVVYQDWVFRYGQGWVLAEPKKSPLVTPEDAQELLQASQDCLAELKDPDNATGRGVIDPRDLWVPHPEQPDKYSPCKFVDTAITSQLPACAEFDRLQRAIKSTILNKVRNAFKYGCSKRSDPADIAMGKPDPIIKIEFNCWKHGVEDFPDRGEFNIGMPLVRHNEYTAQTDDLDSGVMQ